MKKKVIMSMALIVCAFTASHSQSTLKSTPQPTNPKAKSEQTQSTNSEKPASTGRPSTTGNKDQPSAAGQQGAAAGTGQPAPTGKQGGAESTGQPATDGQQGSKGTEQKASARPGGADHKNANDAGRYSDKENDKSMLNSKEAVAKRRKNLTESDTTMKKGSGSAPRNTKNKTGKTGNYQNQQTKNKEN